MASHFQMTYVYLLQSKRFPKHRYVGKTNDLERRIPEHNAGKCASTQPYRPWELVVAIAFTNRHRALEFERYLKSGSGHAFANRHFW